MYLQWLDRDNCNFVNIYMMKETDNILVNASKRKSCIVMMVKGKQRDRDMDQMF